MGIFDTIMQKLGFGDDAEATQNNATTEITEEDVQAVSAPYIPEDETAQPKIDVTAHLEALSQEHPGLNWQTSIVDLLKLLGIDSSYANRKTLAQEMGIDGYEGSAEQNIALHKAVLAKLAENGGNIPQELLS